MFQQLSQHGKILLVVIIAALLSSCSFLSPVNTVQNQFVLNPNTHVGVKRARTDSTILVLKPNASSVYNTPQMAYSTSSHQVAYFAKNRWAATPAEMLQGLMVETLQNTHHYHAVVTVPALGSPNLILYTELLELRQDFTVCPSRLRLKVRAQLLRSGSNTVIATKEFSFSQPAFQSSPYGGVVAANQATSEFLDELAAFCVLRS